MNIRERVIKVLSDMLTSVNVIEYFAENDGLGKLPIDSLVYIKLIVAIENEFNIEFDDEKLDIKSIGTLEELVEYIKTKIMI